MTGLNNGTIKLRRIEEIERIELECTIWNECKFTNCFTHFVERLCSHSPGRNYATLGRLLVTVDGRKKTNLPIAYLYEILANRF